MGLLYYLSYFAILAGFAFVTLSLASGLLYMSELIEEHSRLAKSVGQRSIYIIMLLHLVFYFTEALPWMQTVFSLTCHIVYLQNFSSTWPLISLTSITFLSSCVLVVVDHFIWFFYFSRLTNDLRVARMYRGVSIPEPPGVAEIATFFAICVWYTPLFLFLSLSANDNALPVATHDPSSPSVMMTPIQTKPPRVSLLRSIFTSLSIDSNIPGMRPKPSRRTSEGIIALRSPAPPSRSPIARAYTPGSPALRPLAYPPPPRSPSMKAQEIEVPPVLPGNANFKLDTPPGQSRRTPQLERRGTEDVSGFGLPRINLRKTTGYSTDEN